MALAARDSLFDVIRRRETFATSGPRITPRFFGGWDLPDDLCERNDGVAEGYRSGVPMGSVLMPSESDERAPVFAATVTRDPGVQGHPGSLLDRLQILKVWYGEEGDFPQEIHDIAGRIADDPGAEPASVDLSTCEPRGAGHDELCALWRDPDFDASRAAIYYLRAVENPSCRWSWRECLGIPEAERPSTCKAPEIPRVIQERAWTSPIWYEPSMTFPQSTQAPHEDRPPTSRRAAAPLRDGRASLHELPNRPELAGFTRREELSRAARGDRA